MSIKILSANCQGLGSLEKRLDVLNYLKDVTYIASKTHTPPNHLNACLDPSGTMIVFLVLAHQILEECQFCSEKNLVYSIREHISDPEGNYIISDLTVEENRFTLINLYGPNKDTPIFFDILINIAERIENASVILCGDFNTVQNEKLDYFNYKTINTKKSHDTILQIKENYCLVDPFREAYPSLRGYTWRKKSPIKQARLDYFLISQNLLASVNKSSIEGSYRSDHSMIILDISFIQFQKGKPL